MTTTFTNFLRLLDASMVVQGRNILLFVDIHAAYRQDTIISKLEKLLYYPPQFKSLTPFMRTRHALNTEEGIKCRSDTSVRNSWPHVAPAAYMSCGIFIRGGRGDKHDCQPLPNCAAAHDPYKTVKSFFYITARAGTTNRAYLVFSN